MLISKQVGTTRHHGNLLQVEESPASSVRTITLFLAVLFQNGQYAYHFAGCRCLEAKNEESKVSGKVSGAYVLSMQVSLRLSMRHECSPETQ